ncbi:MAG TPA: tyrosine-type recombinase/integrase [Gemmataceae bacterium]|nr:tyrosine-type recombinase/integrase [Gemmataceae bacterium]
MSKFRVPSYRLHRQSGQAVVTLTDSLTGQRKDHLLGKYNTAASRQEYKRVVLDWEARGRRLPESNGTPELTLAELIARYWRHVEEYYRHVDGTPTGEVQAMRYALRPLNHLYGPLLAQEFNPSALKAVRELLVQGYAHPKYGPQKPLCRTRINAQVKRIRRMFKWAVENGLIAASVHHGLCAVAPLKRGRTQAKESEPVKPVARAVVEDTLPILRPILADMVLLQLETGMRPGELVVLRVCDIDMTGAVWLYRPSSHKTQHHGHDRIIPIGPKGQEIIRRHLKPNLSAYLFSPADAVAEFRARQRQDRKSKVQPSQHYRKKSRPKKRPGEVYTVQAYGHAITQSIKRHNRDKAEGERIPHWHPHQLRHLRALELKREAGLDVARAVLGHRSPILTEHYATLDIAKAASVMEKIG